jgi:hypothetical protein
MLPGDQASAWVSHLNDSMPRKKRVESSIKREVFTWKTGPNGVKSGRNHNRLRKQTEYGKSIIQITNRG